MDKNTKKNTPISTRFTNEKRGEKSVKDMSVSLTELCETCGGKHPIHEDGFEYLDCWNYLLKLKRDLKEVTNE